MAWREDLDSRGAAFERFGVPDECLLLAEAEELSAEEEAAARREAAKRAALEARLEHLQEAREAAAARAAEFDQLSFSRTTSLTDGMLSCLEDLSGGGSRGWPRWRVVSGSRLRAAVSARVLRSTAVW